ncbi:hypothetical protein CK203_101869 [Vitis vinifera]|uniref:Uncharacterized protein n=1 Tax=Vitis vinifera TaxID=29760 RepID=A0A438DR58_VITVI|nr:hypothetical protein CK203_101869 [Vitis vinifera]
MKLNSDGYRKDSQFRSYRSSFTTILILIPMEEFSSIIYRALESGFKGVQYKYFQCVPSSRQLQGLMINLKKSEIIPINVQRFSSVLNYTKRVEGWLSSWKRQYLSKEGKVSLILSTLVSTTYYVYFCHFRSGEGPLIRRFLKLFKITTNKDTRVGNECPAKEICSPKAPTEQVAQRKDTNVASCHYEHFWGWLNALDYPILVVVDVVSTPEVWVSMESLKGSAWKALAWNVELRSSS